MRAYAQGCRGGDHSGCTRAVAAVLHIAAIVADTRTVEGP
jgi:hypothetical protein